MVKHIISEKDALELQTGANTSNTGMRFIKKFMNVVFPSETKRLKFLNSYRVNALYHEMELAGKDGRPVECLVYVANVFDIIIRDLDTQVEDGSFKCWPLVSNKGAT